MPQVSFARDIRPLFGRLHLHVRSGHSCGESASSTLVVAERGLPALSLDLGQRRGLVSKETKRKVSQSCLLDIGGLPCRRENRDAVVTRWCFRQVL
jgi:hypothetical protein